MKKKLLIYSAIITGALMFGFVIWIGLNMAPGSYPYAERYKINVPESRLIDAVQKFKEAHKEYTIPEHISLKDGRSTERDDLWYHVYFYYPEEKQIIHTWVRSSNDKSTTFAFVGIDYMNGIWKMINKDFNRKENKEQKKKFEERILNKIKAMLDQP